MVSGHNLQKFHNRSCYRFSETFFFLSYYENIFVVQCRKSFLTLILLIFFVPKMLTAYYVCCIYSNTLQTNFIMQTNNINRDQTPTKDLHCLPYANSHF